jgi:hypothetical protein
MDQDFIAGLIANPAPLWTCDNAYVSPRSAGYFTIEDADAGEFLYELGLRDGDIPRALNSMSLEFYSDVADAFTTLWSNDGETEYTLEVLRGTNMVTFYYELD